MIHSAVAVPPAPPVRQRGIALLAVLFALTLLAVLALPFAVSMGVGADAAVRDVEQAQVQQASASARDLLLADAALSHPAFDPSPTWDELAEWPDHVEVPEKFAPLRDEGRVLLGGAVWDLQRFLALDGVSPLVLTNVLGNTTRLAAELAPDAAAIVVEDGSRLPETGYLWLAGEVVHYGQKQGNSLGELLRSQFVDQGFVKQEQPVDEGTLVLDYRCVVAATWPFVGRGDGARKLRRPYGSVGELAEIAAAGIGSFTAEELDRFGAALSIDTLTATAATWGRPERVFDAVEAGANTMRVKSALHLGPGSTVRIRDQKTGAVEYGLVMGAANEQFARDLHLPSLFRLALLQPVLQTFPAGDTVVEPLIPVPVNVNTAPLEVLTAVFAEIRRAPGVKVHDGDGRKRQTPLRGISKAEAQALAEAIVTLRAGDPQTPGQGPFHGWQDFCERLLKPRFEAAANDSAKMPWLVLYRNLHTGRDSQIEMGSAPCTFVSGPWVGYRAAASRSRSTVAAGVAARHERTGVAAAMPGFPIERELTTQEQLEDAFLVDRRDPGWLTTPINLGALLVDQSGNGEGGNDPASRYFPHLVPMAFPGGDFGAPRFPSTDPAEAAVTPATAVAVPRPWGREFLRHESFGIALDPRGRDLAKEGPYQMTNIGPRGDGAAAPTAGRHDRIAFPFANQFGFANRFATSAWFEPQTLAGVTLFEHGGGDDQRNRIWLHGRDGNLTLEVIDEAGLDPDPSQSPAGVERTATQWRLPLAELGLPANTPVHLGFTAFGSRPSELSLAVDGLPRGKPKYVTYLTGALKVLDPALGNNSSALPPTGGNERYLDVQVESTEGFPPVGTLRIGTELFEYTAIRGNSFQCQWRDSIGGRAARQTGAEFRPDIPVDSNGKPTIDIATLAQQGVNLDVFPDHPVGAMVELYGYSTLLSEDSPMMPGTTSLEGTLGQFAVARGYIQNPRPIAITPLNRPPLPIGQGIDENWSGDLLLADPVPTGTSQPTEAQAGISDAFPTGGGYALLVQIGFDLSLDELGSLSASVATGGVELVRYSSRQGNKLNGVQRAQTIPGVDAQIAANQYDGTAHKFVTQWEAWLETQDRTKFYDLPTAILWVVPVSIAVQSTQNLWDPVSTGLLEWVQLYPKNDANDTEWVRYDAIVGNKHLVRGNRNAWDRLRYALTNANGRQRVGITRAGGTTSTNAAINNSAWGTVAATAGYIGYVTQLESLFPQIFAARNALRFRGDPFTRTSSHPHNGSTVMQCQRLQLNWGNFGAYNGRPGRHDRVALVQGSIANGTTRPGVEWHTVNWAARRYNADNLAQNRTPPERYGPWPFQLVAFTDGVRGQYLGPPRGTSVLEPRMYDRIVKFPSGELPAAYCENVFLGSGLGRSNVATGIVDEIDVVTHLTEDLVVDEVFGSSAKVLKTVPGLTLNAAGPVPSQQDRSAQFPAGGGLLWIDGEVVGYQSRSNGEFTIATNGRGLLGTEIRDHDRGARVHFLTHRPAAVLAGSVGPREDVLPVQALGAMPVAGTARLGGELLHYSWTRQSGDRASLEMPRWYPPGEDPTSAAAHGLFRRRFGTAPASGGAGELLIAWPFRYWDRQVDQSDDPELAYFQFTTTEGPAFWKTLTWREETRDPRVDVVCLVRTDSKAPWSGDPAATPGLWRFTREAGDERGSTIGAQGSRLEVRFAAVYKPGVVDLQTGKEHAWKTSVRVDKVRVAYEGQTRIVDEQESGR